MKNAASVRNTRTNSPDVITQKAIGLLRDAKNAVDEIVETRRREKLSSTRASHAAREINEIIKVLALYIPNEQ